MDDITLQQIIIFLMVAERLSLSGAARELFLNQAAVSRWIQRLEENLKTKLFARTSRGVELTDYGKFLYSELKPLLERIQNTIHNIRIVNNMPDNILRIGCTRSPEIIGTLSQKMANFERSHPDIMLDIAQCNFQDLQENLLCEKYDCVAAYSVGFDGYQGIETKKIRRCDSYFILSKQHHLAGFDSLDPALMTHETLCLISPVDVRVELHMLNVCKEYGFVPQEIKYVTSREALLLAVKNNRGITINNAYFGKDLEPDIKLYRIENLIHYQYVILAWRKSHKPDLVREFVDSFELDENVRFENP